MADCEYLGKMNKMENLMTRNYNLDYIKGVAILMVIVLHCLTVFKRALFTLLYIEQAVPLFLITTAFLFFSKTSNAGRTNLLVDKLNVKKTVKRIFVPFIVFEIIIVLILLLKSCFSLPTFVLSAGIGYGSYYPWVFFQYWLILPFCLFIFSKFNKWGGVVLIFVSVLCSFLFYYCSQTVDKRLVDASWRLFVGRYIFVPYIAWLLFEKKFVLKYYFPLVIIGIVFMVVHQYIFNLEPWFYTTKSYSWRGVNFPTYYYSGFLFLIMYKFLPYRNSTLKNVLQFFGKNSWEIFLGQMLFFVILPPQHNLLFAILTIPLALVFSVIVSLLYLKISKKYLL
jgi:fucose 4-O-acetylase-like acetyltransferase